jgi:predicted nuclease with TOPRIM domain
MTDDIMRDLVTKHDAVITNLVSSVEHLVNSQTETNKRLEEITKFLTKQVVFSSKLESMDKELVDSFKRVHKRIDDLAEIQASSTGCGSVRLLTKDIERISSDIDKLVTVITDHETSRIKLESYVNSFVSPTALKWVGAFIVGYTVTFGTYVVQSFNTITEVNSRLSVKLDRDMADVDMLMKRVFK